MARNKYETLESIDKKMAELENEKKKLEQAKVNIAEKDNSRLGKLVRSLFRKNMPLQKSEQQAFFKAVADTYAKAVTNGTAVEWKTEDVKSTKVEKVNITESEKDTESTDIAQSIEIDNADENQDVEVAE